jgi:poly-gamma-glutamate capsule biosynthesis protein CapA/YwtB (metallophosphatase superfamily)
MKKTFLGLLIFIFMACRQNTPTEIEKSIKPENTLKLMFAGDIMSQLLQIESGLQTDGSYDFSPCYKYIAPVLKTADVVIGNLECTLPGKPPYTGYPNFKTPDALAKALKKAGFDILVTANNHVLDAGTEGIKHTNQVIRSQNMLQTGSSSDLARHDLLYPLIFYKNGFKIALLNYAHHTNGYPLPKNMVVNSLKDMAKVKADLAKAQAMKPDFTIVFVHWGDEYQLSENSQQRGVAQLLHNWGANLVVGGHPHVVQPIKNERFTKQGKLCLTAYSLGNFISAQPFANTEGGIVLEVDLQKKPTGITEITNHAYIPVVRYTPEIRGKTQFYVLPVSAFEGKEDSLNMPDDERQKMHYFAKRVRAQLGKFGTKEHFLK